MDESNTETVNLKLVVTKAALEDPDKEQLARELSLLAEEAIRDLIVR